MPITAELRVSTDELDAQASVVEDTVNNIRTEVAAAEEALDGATYWLGIASDMYRGGLSDRRQEIEDALRRMGEYPERLRRIAGVYRSAEDESDAAASQLAPDVPLV